MENLIWVEPSHNFKNKVLFYFGNPECKHGDDWDDPLDEAGLPSNEYIRSVYLAELPNEEGFQHIRSDDKFRNFSYDEVRDYRLPLILSPIIVNFGDDSEDVLCDLLRLNGIKIEKLEDFLAAEGSIGNRENFEKMWDAFQKYGTELKN